LILASDREVPSYNRGLVIKPGSTVPAELFELTRYALTF
jgi:hypothetical protein